jgi:hypothetical protein
VALQVVSPLHSEEGPWWIVAVKSILAVGAMAAAAWVIGSTGPAWVPAAFFAATAAACVLSFRNAGITVWAYGLVASCLMMERAREISWYEPLAGLLVAGITLTLRERWIYRAAARRMSVALEPPPPKWVRAILVLSIPAGVAGALGVLVFLRNPHESLMKWGGLLSGGLLMAWISLAGTILRFIPSFRKLKFAGLWWAIDRIALIVVLGFLAGFYWGHRDAQETEARATVLINAIEAHHKDHQAYPSDLAKLVPEYIGEVPVPKVGWKSQTFEYIIADGSYVLIFRSNLGARIWHSQTREWVGGTLF